MKINAVCRDLRASRSHTGVVCGHLPAGSQPYLRVSGGSDSGSGVISILSITRRIKQTGISFGTIVELVEFAEEQGLYGSKVYHAQVETRPAPQKSVICNLNIDFDMKTPGSYWLTTSQMRREVIKRMREESQQTICLL